MKIAKLLIGWAVYAGTTREFCIGRYKTRFDACYRVAEIEYENPTSGWSAENNVRLDADDTDLARARLQLAREVALHRKFGGKLRRRPMPKAIHPKPIEVEYAKALVSVVRAAREAYAPLLAAIRASKNTRKDALPKGPGNNGYSQPELTGTYYTELKPRDAKKLLDDAESNLKAAVDKTEVESLASKFAARTSSYQRVQLGRQVRAALGADPYMRDPVLAGKQEDFVATNVSLIQRIPKRLHEKVEGLVMNSITKSGLNIDLASEIEKQFNVSEKHAMLIARDQVSKYYGSVNRARQRELGVKKFIWRTVNDERVRDTHADLEGIEFSWDDLPTNDKGEDIYPGSEIQCRCNAEPVMDDILDDVDDAEDELDSPGDSFDDVLEPDDVESDDVEDDDAE